MTPLEYASNAAYPWILTYTPIGGDSGQVDVTFNGFTASMTLDTGHRGDGAELNRFGLLNVVKHPDTAGTPWIDDVVINGDAEDFNTDPGWEEFQNHASYLSEDTRPRFAFGYSATQNSGGLVPGEIGGRLFRGDCRFAGTLAYYGDVVADMSLETPLEASGKVSLHRAVSDSTTLFGFFNSEASVFVNPSQSNGLPKEFMGWAIEGPSAEGFYMYPCYRTQVDGADRNYASNLQYIYPDSQAKDWSFNYDPEGNGGDGEISLTYDGQTSILPVQPGHKAMGATFDRFGFVTTWIDGNNQLVFVDDLTYTLDVPTTAQFSATPREGDAPLEVTFTDESTSKFAITSRTWDFGDESPTSNDANPVHTYAVDGAYTVGLTIATTEDSDTETSQWYIDVGNSLPGPGVVALGILAAVMASYGGYRIRRR